MILLESFASLCALLSLAPVERPLFHRARLGDVELLWDEHTANAVLDQIAVRPVVENVSLDLSTIVKSAMRAVLAVLALHAQSNASWNKLDFLLGDWTGVAGEQDTPVGAGQGAFSFKPELKQHIVVRRSKAHYALGVEHDDLMVIYLEDLNSAPRAIYFDTEGHVIQYTLNFPSPERVVFESDGTQAGPKYRLTYWMENSSLNGRFEIAKPAGEYKTYMSWTSKRR